MTEKETSEFNIKKKFRHVIFGEEHTFLSHWINQVSEMARDGALGSTWMRREAQHIGIHIDDFKNFGVNLDKDHLFTGHISYNERDREGRIIVKKFSAFIASYPIRNHKNSTKKNDL